VSENHIMRGGELASHSMSGVVLSGPATAAGERQDDGGGGDED
jgi:hypothetical protein